MNLRVKDICRQKGLLMKELAEKLEIHPNNLSMALNGNPTLDTLEKIATALGVPISALFADSVQTLLSCPECGAKLKLVKDAEDIPK